MNVRFLQATTRSVAAALAELKRQFGPFGRYENSAVAAATAPARDVNQNANHNDAGDDDQALLQAAVDHRNSEPVRRLERIIWRDANAWRVDILKGLCCIIQAARPEPDHVVEAARRVLLEYHTLWEVENQFIFALFNFDEDLQGETGEAVVARMINDL
jgi:hypothetical protein